MKEKEREETVLTIQIYDKQCIGYDYTYNMYYVCALCYILSILENHDQPLIQGGFRHSGWMA